MPWICPKNNQPQAGPYESLLETTSADKWKKISLKRRCGLLVPLSSVYSRNSVGTGEFEDLRLVIDFCRQSGNSILQLLPLNETGINFCPYDSLSSFALEPAYLSLEKIPGIKKKLIESGIERIKEEFPAGGPYVNYRIKQRKLELLRDIFGREDNIFCAEFKTFVKENTYWLDDFALFRALKDYHSGRPWYEWQEPYKNRQAGQLEVFRREHEKEITFHLWLQWLVFRQLKEVKKYARHRGILIKGDLPVLVSRDSADVWRNPEFFKLEFASGAPPDMYAALGQRWGMPTYNWERIAGDGYRYLKEKLRYARNFYDILRIDHVVGLFRIWSIPYNEPLENQGLNGFFDPPEEARWAKQGSDILNIMLNASDMLLCAEDLGVIPKACTDTLRELGIPGNDVQRWAKDWKERHDFLLAQEYRGLSVAMLSTHDTTNWPAWWENEAGTVDEALFIRKCFGRVDYAAVKDRLFDASLSRRGRLRWLNSVDSPDKLIRGLPAIGGAQGTVPAEHLKDFIDLWKDTYHEKEKLWNLFGFLTPMREKSDANIVRHALKMNLACRAIFCINTLIDWLYLTGAFKGDPYDYRINTPGTISDKNWSLVMPFSLEELLKHKVCGEIKTMAAASGRI